MDFTLAGITAWLVQFGYLAIIPFVMLEGPIITVIAGSLCSAGIFKFFIALAVIIFADLVADCLYYAFGRFGKEKFLAKYGHYIGINPARAIQLENHFIGNGGKTLFLGKISHGLGGIFLVAAGLAGMPLPKFLWYNFLARSICSRSSDD